MTSFVFRDAVVNDIPFLVDTIIEAEKSGTNKLSYCTVFGLTEAETGEYLSKMLSEEIDGCELSISSFLIAEKNGHTAAALSAWIEGFQGIPSAMLKGNLLNFILPRENTKKASLVSPIIRELNIEYSPNTIQIGAGYVSREFRGNNLLGTLTGEIIKRLVKMKPDVSEVYAQIFSCNVPSIRTYEKAGFHTILEKEAVNKEIRFYLPSDKKILMKKEIFTL